MGSLDDAMRRVAAADQAIARIDDYRQRHRAVGSILVTEATRPIESPERVLLDVTPLDGKALLAAYIEYHAAFATAPFDPEGKALRMYPGGLTIWSGYPGSGKTTLLRHLAVHLMARGEGVFFASLEEDPSHLIVRLAATAAGIAEPSAHQVQWFIDRYGELLRVWGVIGIAKRRQLLAVIEALAGVGTKHAIIDSLMCLDVANDDFEDQRQFANQLATLARAKRIHLHLVAHPRKAISAEQQPDINDVAGAREIGGVADNVLFIRRAGVEPVESGPRPMIVAIRKQRHEPGSVANIDGWFLPHARQFSRDRWATAIRYLPADAYDA